MTHYYPASPLGGIALLLVAGLWHRVEMLHLELPVSIDRGKERALEATLEVDLDATARRCARGLYQRVRGRVAVVPELRSQSQSDGAGRRFREDRSRLRVDVAHYARSAGGDGGRFPGKLLRQACTGLLLRLLRGR